MSSDVGWGCMIRSGQMMLANALIQLKLGRHWNWNGPTRSIYMAEDLCDELVHRNIIQIFGDFYNEDTSPLSIQNIMTTAKETMNRKPGDWFGPTTVSHLLKKTFDKYTNNHSVLKNLKIYVAKDSTVYKGDIYAMCRIKQNAKACPSYDSLINLDEYSIIDPSEIQQYNMSSASPQFDLYQESENISTDTTTTTPYLISDCDHIHVENEENMSLPPSSLYHNFRKFRRRSQSCPSISKAGWTPVLILIPVKIGRDQKINPIYGQCLKSFLATDTCVGIIGGKPKHSLYFVGFQVSLYFAIFFFKKGKKKTNVFQQLYEFLSKFQDDNLIHLDPHLVQDGVDIFKEDFDLQSYHSKTPRKLPLNKMDPSCCIGFLIETEHQFDGWCQMSAELAAPTSKSGHRYPMFSIVDGHNVPNVSEVLNDAYQLDSIDEAGLDATLTIPHNPREEDEFVFL